MSTSSTAPTHPQTYRPPVIRKASCVMAGPICRPVAGSHSLTVWSTDHDKMRVSSRLSSAPVTSSACIIAGPICLLSTCRLVPQPHSVVPGPRQDRKRPAHHASRVAIRRWTTAEKLRIVEESLAAGMSVVQFARQRDLHPNLVHTWRWQARKGMLSQHFRPQYVLRCQHDARCHAERTDG